MALDVLIVTSSRADWGLLRPVASLLREDPYFQLSIVATGTHLSERFGHTVDDIERDGFEVTRRLPILDEGDDKSATVRALAAVTAGMIDVLAGCKPDIAIVLGDRYEILGAAQACVLSGVPVAHLCGGDLTEGAFDDAIRHAISKLSHLHFPSNSDAGNRLIRMGEDPARITVAGSTGLDTLRETQFLSREETFERLGLQNSECLCLVTFHPPTLSAVPGPRQFAELTAAIDGLDSSVAVVFTGSNADPAGWELTKLAETFAASRPNTVFLISLGQTLYLSTMRHAAVIIGNSSSGLYEAPSFGVPTVNIGDRQKGRLRASSVLDTAPECAAIRSAIDTAISGDWKNVNNPYGDGRAAPRIIARLRELDTPSALLTKIFYDKGVH